MSLLTPMDNILQTLLCQAKLVARVLSGRAQLPGKECMDRAIQAFYQTLEDRGLPIRYTHSQSGVMPENQWVYNDSIGTVLTPFPRCNQS